MKADFRGTAHHLWHTAPYWRYSVIGAGAFSALFVVSLVFGPSGPRTVDISFTPSPAPYTPPAPVPDPATEAQLQAYDTAFAAAASLSPGRRCEEVGEAYGRLSDVDVRAGRNVRLSSRTRIQALTQGQHCQTDIAASDRRFTDLADAIAAARSHLSADASQTVSQTYGDLTDFDQSRALYTWDSPLIIRAQAIVKAEAESQSRIKALAQAVDALQTDQSPAAYVRAADALRALTDADRARLKSDQQSMVATADQAAEKVGGSRSRLDRVVRLLPTTGANPDAASAQELVAAIASITPFDEALASPQQKDLLSRARSAATPLAWSLLEKALVALEKDKSAERYSAVSQLYDLLKNSRLMQTADQQHLLTEAQQTAEFLPASDTRLQAMQQAAQSWRQTGLQARDVVITTLRNTTAFDQGRFDASMTDDWNLLQRASVILHGPEMGLTMTDRDRMPIFVFTHGEGEHDRQFVNSLENALSAAGYRVTGKHDDAALLTEVSIQAVSDPALDTSGQVATYTSVAQIAAATRWASDDSVLFSDRLVAPASGNSPGSVRVSALLAGVDQIVVRFQQVTTR